LNGYDDLYPAIDFNKEWSEAVEDCHICKGAYTSYCSATPPPGVVYENGKIIGYYELH
jgi:hypothetical protein